MWDPATYQRYGDERSRPFGDLLARVPAERPRAVVDLGCGPGTLTTRLARRWPHARVSGLDSSAEMIRAAVGQPGPATFQVGDLCDWRPGPDVDVVVCNATLQWVPGHQRLLTDWVGRLPAGAWLAVQVPGNFAAPSHRALAELAGEPRWAHRLATVLRDQPVDDPAGYARLLLDAGCTVDAWETTYVHLLPAAVPESESERGHPVLRWMEGTALRPVRAALADDPTAWAAFRDALGERLAGAYPIQGDVVAFPFRRIFFVARTATRPQGPS